MVSWMVGMGGFSVKWGGRTLDIAEYVGLAVLQDAHVVQNTDLATRNFNKIGER